MGVSSFCKTLEKIEDLLEKGNLITFLQWTIIHAEKIQELIEKSNIYMPAEIRESYKNGFDSEIIKLILDLKRKITDGYKIPILPLIIVNYFKTRAILTEVRLNLPGEMQEALKFINNCEYNYIKK